MQSKNTQQFWELIAEDHLWFIYHALGKSETEWIERVTDLYGTANGSAENFLQRTLELKKELLAEKLKGTVEIDLLPNFINHMINEAEAGLREIQGEEEHELDLHKLWLLDASGHLVAIMHKLDPLEKELHKEVKDGSKKFQELFLKALEFIGYLRTGEDHFAVFEHLTEEARIETMMYLELLALIRDKAEHNEIQHHLHPLLLDHMLREQSYYLHKLGVDTDNSQIVDSFNIGVEFPGFH